MIKYTLFAFLTIFLFGIATAQDIPDRPKKQQLVNDFANVLNQNEEQQLERKLVDYFAATSTQIAVVTVEDIGGYDIADYAFRLGEKWGVGDAEFNNGIVVLVKPKTGSDRGQVFIATGYGLEGAVPDITAKQVVENEMIPAFKAGSIYAGIDQGTNVLIELTKGEYSAKQYAQKVESSGGFNPFVLFFVLFFVFPVLFGRRRRAYGMGRRSSLPFWLALGMFGSGRSSHGGLYNDFRSGSGSFGGGSFGSGGGFGGGSFGGGGAGGSW